MSNEEFAKIQTCALKVNIHCDRCKGKVKKILMEIKEVVLVKIYPEQSKVTVSGDITSDTLIKKLADNHKVAEVWGVSKPNPNQQINNQLVEFQTCALKVNIHCDGCKGEVKKILMEIQGVRSVKIYPEQSKVTVSGHITSDTLIKKLRGVGKDAEVWSVSKPNPNQLKNLQTEGGGKVAEVSGVSKPNPNQQINNQLKNLQTEGGGCGGAEGGCGGKNNNQGQKELLTDFVCLLFYVFIALFFFSITRKPSPTGDLVGSNLSTLGFISAGLGLLLLVVVGGNSKNKEKAD